MSVLRMCVDMYAFVYVSKELGNLTDELFFFPVNLFLSQRNALIISS